MSDRGPKSEMTRRSILDAAAALFGERGYAAATMRQIAERTGIDASSVYYHFKSKEEVLDEVLRMGVRAVFDAVESALAKLPKTASHRERIELAVRTHLTTLLQSSVFTAANIAVFAQVPLEAQQRNRELRRGYADYWVGLLRAAQAAGEIAPEADLSLLRLLLLGSINWSLQWYDPQKKSIDEIAQTFCAIVFDGVGKPSRDA